MAAAAHELNVMSAAMPTIRVGDGVGNILAAQLMLSSNNHLFDGRNYLTTSQNE